jgi:hypothetical protein
MITTRVRRSLTSCLRVKVGVGVRRADGVYGLLYCFSRRPLYTYYLIFTTDYLLAGGLFVKTQARSFIHLL